MCKHNTVDYTKTNMKSRFTIKVLTFTERAKMLSQVIMQDLASGVTK